MADCKLSGAVYDNEDWPIKNTPTAMANQTLTVENALKELREMWPNCTAEIVTTTAMGFYKPSKTWFEVAFISTNYMVNERFKGSTLDECMAQVRQWKESQSQ